MPGSITALEELILEKRIRIHVNPALRSAVASARFFMSPAGLRRFEKNKPGGRIDLAVALAMATGAATVAVPRSSRASTRCSSSEGSMNRAYSILTVKRVDDDARIIEGIATTPTPDRMGDIVEPLGVQFKNPSPLLWQHDSTKPVGTVTFGKPTKDGVAFKARIERSTSPAR